MKTYFIKPVFGKFAVMERTVWDDKEDSPELCDTTVCIKDTRSEAQREIYKLMLREVTEYFAGGAGNDRG